MRPVGTGVRAGALLQEVAMVKVPIKESPA